MSGRKAPAPCRARPATARAAPRPTVTDANLVLGYLDPEHFLGGERPARPGRRPSARSTASPRALGIERARRGARHPPHRQHQHGRGGAARLGAARRRSAPLRAVRLRRRGRAARHRHRPPARPHAGHRAARRRGAVGLGHAGDRSALRGRRAPISATPARSTAPRSSACSTRWRPRGWRGCAPRSPGRCAPRRSVDMRYGEQVFEIAVPLDGVDWSAPTRCRRSSSASTAATRRSTPTRCPTRRACWSMPASPSSGVLEELPQEPICRPAPPAPPRGERRIYLDGLGHRAGLRFRRAGRRRRAIAGPAIIESAMTTVLLRPGDRAAGDRARLARHRGSRVGPRAGRDPWVSL